MSGADRFPSGIAEVHYRLKKLGPVEIERQLYMARMSQIGIRKTRSKSTAESFEHASVASMCKEEANARWRFKADQIADVICSTAVETEESAAWMGLQPLHDGNGWTFYRLGDDFYSGAAGIAIFLAAHARVTGSNRSHALAKKALAAVRHTMRTDGSKCARVMGIGAVGLGGAIYALTTAGALLGDDALIHDAAYVADLVIDQHIQRDGNCDVIDGSAGAILGLMRLYRETGERHAIERAIACARHLVTKLHTIETGAQFVPRRDGGAPLTGFSHGVSGMALALNSVGKASGLNEFSEAVAGLLTYERGLFDPERSNWPDLRDLDQRGVPAWLSQWCHGAAGIGLSRLGLLKADASDASFRAEIMTAAATAQAFGFSADDTFCCGNLGNIEFLMEAAHCLGNEGYKHAAQIRLFRVLNTAEHRGSFNWPVGRDHENLGLFLGLSGIGYGLLRQLHPHTLPNVLIWS